ncbi:MAG: hypothetical protein K0B16_08490 [Burkholderiaceae bacterium]|nr:hypothetical protein [Burkholderiaceae bacterium]
MPDVAGQQAQQFGRDLSSLGQHVGAIALDMQREANATAAKDIDTQVTADLNDRLHNPESGFLLQEGKNAVLGSGDVIKGFDDIKRQALDGVQNPAVRKMAEPVVNARMQNALDAVNRHAGQESRKYQIQAADSRAIVSLQDAAFNYTDDNRFAQAVGVAQEETATLAKLNGWDEATAQLQATKYRDAGNEMRYDAWRLTDPLAAFASFQRNAEQVSPLKREQIARQLFQAAAPAMAAQINQAGGVGVVAPAPGNASGPQPRGVRNNNPGNVMKGSDSWRGEVQGNDPRYVTFATPEAGIRAMAKTLLTYQDKHGLDTVESIVSRWAPATENNTVAYAATVAKEIGVKPGDPLNLHDTGTLTKLTRAMIRVENGQQPYTDEQIASGLAAATEGKPLPTAAAGSPQRDPTGPTGYPMLDALPSDWKLHVLQLARAQSNQGMAEARDVLRSRVQDATSAYLTTGFAPDAPSEGEFISAYGQADGVKRFAEFKGAAQLGQTLQQVKTLPVAALADMLETAKPTPGEGFAARQQNYEILTKAIDQVKQARAADPVGYAMAAGSYGIKPLQRFDYPKDLQRELSRRAGAAQQMAVDYGTRPTIMSAQEADAFGQYLGSLQSVDKARVLGQVFAGVGPAGVQSLSTQLNDKHGTLAVAAMLSAHRTSEGNNAALLYLQGKEAIEQNRAKINDAKEYGTRAKIYKALEGVYQTPQGLAAAAEAAYGIYAKFRADGGGDVEQAVNIATGGVVEHNGGKIAKPYGWSDSRFTDALKTTLPARLIAQGGTFTAGGAALKAADLAKFLPAARLQTFGQGSYLIRVGGDVVRDATGAPFVLKVAP